MNIRERPFREIPLAVRVVFPIALILQLLYSGFYSSTLTSQFEELDEPAELSVYRASSLGSEYLLAYLLTLRVQLHDAQSGQHVPYSKLDFERLKTWLLTIYELNPWSDYPAFLAARVYSQNPDPDKLRTMISVVDTLFDRNPRQHWRRMTEACLLAKHHLKDMPLALSLARKLSRMPREIRTPYWARDMEIILLDEMNEKESARMLISSLLQSGEIKDADERRFLQRRLLRIQQTLSNPEQKLN